VVENLHTRPETTWIEPIPYGMVAADDPAEETESRESIRLAFVAALQHLPARQRAALILCEVLRWRASEAAELLDMSTAAINSALQRARATLDSSGTSLQDAPRVIDPAQRELLARYVEAFQSYDIDGLTAVIQEDAQMSMPPYDLWLHGRDDIFAWFLGPGIGCRGSRLIPVQAANGTMAWGQYKPNETGSGHDPWSLHVVELGDNGVAELTYFLDTERLFPLFGLPPRLGS
jgi:RNA polymerase sigma-70 factor (ECF subfamily)